MGTDRVVTHLHEVRTRHRAGAYGGRVVRRAQLEADRIRDLEADLVWERNARIRMEALAQRHGAAGWEIDRARTGGGS
jgi:hypothetical protein